MALKDDYKDDILDVSVNTKRKYRMTENQDGTVSFDDETVYTQEGDSFGASDINAITEAVNNNSGMPVGTIATFDGTTLPSGFEPYQTEEQRAIAQINDNLAQTPITVGGETLSTIDDKLNFLIEGAVKITIPALSSQASGSGRLILNFRIDTTQYSTLTIGELNFGGTMTFTIKDQNNTTLYSTTTTGTAITVNISTATSITIEADANASGAWCALGNITLE